MKKFMNQENMKYENCIDVFRLIKEKGRMTRKQIEEETGLSWGAVSNITARLDSHGYITGQKTKENSGPGRTPSYLEVDGSRYGTLGIDVNITGMRAELVDLRNEPVKAWNGETDHSSKEALLGCIFRILDMALSDKVSQRYEIAGIGVAMQGIVDAKRGISVRLPRCSGWDRVPLAAMLEERCGIPVWLEHDPDCILYAYAKKCEEQDMILLRIDKGIGMAIMLDGKIRGGTGRLEIGHTIAVPGGERCICGQRGCLEVYTSTEGVEKLSGKSLKSLAEAAEGKGSELLDAEGMAAKSLFMDVGQKLGTAIYNVRKIFNVSEILLCGEMMENSRFFMDAVTRINEGARFTTVDAGRASYGAAVIALDHAVQRMKI